MIDFPTSESISDNNLVISSTLMFPYESYTSLSLNYLNLSLLNEKFSTPLNIISNLSL